MHRHMRLALATATAVALTGGLLTFAASPATAADSTHVELADFNGDGRGDVATSVTGAYVDGKARAGQFAVLYGTSTGVSSAKRHTISQNTKGVPGGAETDDNFGYDHAFADFNGDGYDDVAVSAPYEDLGSDKDAGLLSILWGSASGITGKSITVEDPTPSSHDLWGKNLAAGDFDGDGKADLAVGTDHAKIHVFKGGFTTAGTSGGRYTITPPIMGAEVDGPLNLTAGDVDGGATDLVVDGYETTSAYGWNRNYFIPGTTTGLKASAAKALKPGVITAIGDIDQDGFGDIVSGAGWDSTLEDGTTVPDAAKGGKVWVTPGSASGPRTGSATGITQNSGNIPGASEKNDYFGYELDLGDINGDSYLDLVIGVAGEDIESEVDTGMIVILHGTANGLSTTSGVQSFHQNNTGVPGGNEDHDGFGLDVKLDDVTGDGRADLIVGSAEDKGDGAMVYMPSNGTKITTSGSRFIAPDTSGVSRSGTPYFGSNFAD